MEKTVPDVLKLFSGAQNTRKNFGAAAARKHGEAKFMRAFECVWFEKVKARGVAAGEFPLAGFGVADLIWIGWAPEPRSEEFTAVSLERQWKRRHLFAFEGKLKDWRRALQQAFRYRYFADKAIVVMPRENSKPAVANLDIFQQFQVGLWTFDRAMGTIREHHTPTRVRAFSKEARGKAIRTLSSKIDFSQFSK